MISIIGLGFVGLTTGLGFAKKGFKTFGIDIDKDRLNKLRSGVIPFHEPHLAEVLKERYNQSFFLDVPLEQAVMESKAIFLCVGTPGAPDGSADLKYIFGAVDQILAVPFDDFKVIVIKSTVPPSTISKKVKPYVEAKAKASGRKIGLASNPEFLREGHCWEDFIEPDRIVIGAEDEQSKTLLDSIYAPFNAPVHYVTYNSAEFIKYLSNTLLSTLISYSNEMAVVADAIGDIDVPKAFRILHQDKRWFGSPAAMSSYVYPGCGYGGYCLPKDTSALHSIAKENGFEASVLAANLRMNEEVKDFVASKVAGQVKTDEYIGILGLSFKPGSDDVRLTPSRDVILRLQEKGYRKLVAYDPMANQVFKEEYPEIELEYVDSLDKVLAKCENVVILTGWSEFKEKKDKIQTKRVFDFRYIY